MKVIPRQLVVKVAVHLSLRQWRVVPLTNSLFKCLLAHQEHPQETRHLSNANSNNNENRQQHQPTIFTKWLLSSSKVPSLFSTTPPRTVLATSFSSPSSRNAQISQICSSCSGKWLRSGRA